MKPELFDAFARIQQQKTRGRNVLQSWEDIFQDSLSRALAQTLRRTSEEMEKRLSEATERYVKPAAAEMARREAPKLALRADAFQLGGSFAWTGDNATCLGCGRTCEISGDRFVCGRCNLEWMCGTGAFVGPAAAAPEPCS